MSDNPTNNDNINFDNIDLYDLFNIEYNDIIYDLYDEVNEYSNSHHNNFYNEGNIGEFVNLIYNNIDYENSSVILKNIIKNRIKEYEIDVNEYNDDFQEDEIY
tara:strand:+ start:1379 stop:1687 length:309 start_codon:yes stop_codon:yes gene_type:complete